MSAAITPASLPTLRLSTHHRGLQEQPITELLYMQSYANYTWLVWCNGDRVLMPHTMKYFEARVPTGQFVRIHRQYSVNTGHIDRVERASSQLMVRLSNGACLLVSRRRLAGVRAKLRQYINPIGD